MGNPVTWFEVNTADPAKEAAFYGELFGWHTEVMEQAGYTLIDTHSRANEEGSRGINGGLGQTTEGRPAMATLYVEGPDLQALLDKAESLGAKTILPIQESEMVTFAMFLDPFGNAVGLVKGDGSTRVSEGDNPPVTWFEIACTEPRKAWDFYRDLFGWKIEDASTEQMVYGMVDTGSGGQGIPGGIGASQDGRPRITVYAQVDDLQKYLERAEAGGANTIVQPTPVAEDTSIALFVDPQGVPFGLFVHQH
jgi:uncharacterized protein